jgi:hypothetical protein
MDHIEEDGLRAYARMMNNLSLGDFPDHLVDDFVYESQSVLEPLRSKQAFVQYIVPKLRTIAATGAAVFAEMARISAYGRHGPCVVLAQGSRDNLVAVVLATVRDGKLSRLDLCVVPHPSSASRSGEYPI